MFDLIIGTGSNLGDRKKNLFTAKSNILQEFELVDESSIYESMAVDYEKQPRFLNQILQFKISENIDPQEILKKMQNIENKMGRIRKISKGPRNIDIDIIFISNLRYKSETLTIPHSKWNQRSFVVVPLKELPFYSDFKVQLKVNDSLLIGKAVLYYTN